MGKVRLGKVLIEQKEIVGTPDGNNLPLIGVNNREGLHPSKYKRLSNVSRYKLLKKNWFAYNPMRINIGSIGFARSDKETGIISPDYVVFSCSDMIDPEYFFHFIKSKAGLIEISKNTGGSVRERLYFQNLAKIEIELPALKDQKRIAGFLNKKKELIEQLYKESRYLEQDLSLLRNCILQQAVQGKLTKQHKDDEPADKLLQRIKAEKQKLIVAGKLKKEKKLLPITEDEIPFELPKGWVWCRLGEVIFEYQNGISTRNSLGGKETIVLRLSDIQDNEISVQDTRKISLPLDLIRKYELKTNDILVIRVNGSAQIVGRFIDVVSNSNLTYCDHFIRVRVIANELFSKYISLVANSTFSRNKIADLFITTAGQKTVNQSHISSLLFPLPPFAEQQRIVTKVNQLLQMVNQLEQQVVHSQTQAGNLLQAVLKEAFRSEAEDYAENDKISVAAEIN